MGAFRARQKAEMTVDCGVYVDGRRIDVEAPHAERIFKLKREVLNFRGAVPPLEVVLVELGLGSSLIHMEASE